MTWTGKWLSTTAIMVLAGCSSGVETESASAAPDEPPMPENTPPLNSSSPALSAQSLNPQAPSLSEDLSASDTTTCAGLCSALQSAGCEAPDCVTSCTEGLPDLGACSNEFVVLIRCMVTQPGFDCGAGLTDLEDGQDASESSAFAGCSQETLALAQCMGSDPFATDQARGNEGTCTLEGDACDGCDDACEACHCLYDSSGTAEEQCMQICANTDA